MLPVQQPCPYAPPKEGAPTNLVSEACLLTPVHPAGGLWRWPKQFQGRGRSCVLVKQGANRRGEGGRGAVDCTACQDHPMRSFRQRLKGRHSPPERSGGAGSRPEKRPSRGPSGARGTLGNAQDLGPLPQNAVPRRSGRSPGLRARAETSTHQPASVTAFAHALVLPIRYTARLAAAARSQQA